MEITIKNIIKLVHELMRKDECTMWVTSSCIWIYKENKIILKLNYIQYANTLEIETLSGGIVLDLSESEYNLFRVLIDETKEYSENKAKSDFFNLYNELSLIID